MIVIALEGTHAVGKTLLLNELKQQGYNVLPEKFMYQQIPFLSKFSIYAQTLNLVTWIKDVLEYKRNGCKVLITDRSPHTTLIYSKEPAYDNIVKKLLTELAEVNVVLVTINIVCEEKMHWNRVLERLKVEPERSEYNEQSREWFEYVRKAYSEHPWDHVISNDGSLKDTTKSIKDVMSNVVCEEFD